MKLNNLRSIIQEELKKTLNEEYIDKYKVKGIIITDTTVRPQQEILSDIRSLTGVTIVSTVDLDGSYSRKIQDIINSVKRVEGVKSFIVNPQNITQM